MKRRPDVPDAAWIAIGAGIGIVLGVLFDRVAVGVGAGAALGVVVMAVQRSRHTNDTDAGRGQ